MTEQKRSLAAVERSGIAIICRKIKITAAETVEGNFDIKIFRCTVKGPGKLQSLAVIA